MDHESQQEYVKSEQLCHVPGSEDSILCAPMGYYRMCGARALEIVQKESPSTSTEEGDPSPMNSIS